MPPPLTTGAELDDATLLRAVQRGDIECFAPLVDRHLAAVRTFLSLKAPVPQLVDEIAHDTFLFAFRHIGDFEPGTSLRNWLRAIAWNLLRAEVLRFSRRQARFVQLEEAWLLEVEREAEPGYTADTEFLEECFAALPENARLLLNLHYQEGNDSSEIAARLTRSRSWVRTTLFRLRQQLRTCIESKRAPGPRVGMQSHG